MKEKRCNIYKPGSAKYYRDGLVIISAVAIDYDGYDIHNAKQMKELVDDLKEIADGYLNHKKMYIKLEGK